MDLLSLILVRQRGDIFFFLKRPQRKKIRAYGMLN
jgi:hypothetical protein